MVIITNFTVPETGVLHHEVACQLRVGEVNVGTGDLYVTESAVVWANSQSSQCFTLNYRQISLHAVQRVPEPLIFMVLDYTLRLPGQPEPSDMGDDDDYDPDEPPCTEVRFVPQNDGSLLAIYEALNKGQILHPSEQEEDDVDEQFMVADEDPSEPDDAAAQMGELSIEPSSHNGHKTEDEEEDQFADA